MADPVTGFMAVSAIVGAGGAIYSGVQQKREASYNAKVEEQAAKAAEKKAKYDASIHRERVQEILSTQRALYGKAGVGMTGTPMRVMQETARQGEVDAMAIRYGGDVEAARRRSSATLARMEGRRAQTSSYMTAGSTLLTSGAKYYQRKNRLLDQG